MKRWLLCVSLLASAGLIRLACTGYPPPSLEGKKEKKRDYFAEVRQIKERQQELRRAFSEGRNQDSLVKVASNYIHYQVSRNLYDYWYGTPWEFYGTTDTPQVGSIACGYFVTTLLRDAGVKLNRRELAETYSEKMINTLIQRNCIKKYTPFNLPDFVNDLKQKGDGLYIVGLDLHTGFMSVENGEVWFIHSTVLSPGCVIKEKAIGSAALIYNKYTVCGCLTRDREFITRWIKGS